LFNYNKSVIRKICKWDYEKCQDQNTILYTLQITPFLISPKGETFTFPLGGIPIAIGRDGGNKIVKLLLILIKIIYQISESL